MESEKFSRLRFYRSMVLDFKNTRMTKSVECILLAVNFDNECVKLVPVDLIEYEENEFWTSIDFIELPKEENDINQTVMNQKFSDRFLPRKVSKHEKRARAIHVKILTDFNDYLKDLNMVNPDLKTSYINFLRSYKLTYLAKYGGIGKRVLDVIQKQVDETNPLEA